MSANPRCIPEGQKTGAVQDLAAIPVAPCLAILDRLSSKGDPNHRYSLNKTAAEFWEDYDANNKQQPGSR